MVAMMPNENIGASIAANNVDDNDATPTGSKMSDVQIEHLDYGYIGKCKDIKYLEAILKVLRSGKEGLFPDLIEFTENRLRVLAPSSKLLNLPQPIKQKWALNKDELRDLSEDLDSFVSEIKEEDSSGQDAMLQPEDTSIPVRGSNNVISKNVDKSSNGHNGTKEKEDTRIRSGDYRAWDKFNVDEACEKMDEEQQPPVKTDSAGGDQQTKLPSESVKCEDLPDAEVEKRANKEKEKGNESFKANDFDEAIVYYTRSLKLLESAAVYNNRCLAYLRKENYSASLMDAEQVLAMEPENTKALLRMSQAYLALKDYNKARMKLDEVFRIHPDNAHALKIKLDIDKKNPPPAPGAKRLLIEECEDDDDDDEENEQENKEANQQSEDTKREQSEKVERTVEQVTVSQTVDAMECESVVPESVEVTENKSITPPIVENDQQSEILMDTEVRETSGKEVSENQNDIWSSEEVKQNDEEEFYDCSNKTPAPSPPAQNFPQKYSSSSKLDDLHLNGHNHPVAKPTPVIPEIVMYHKDIANKYYRSGQYHEAMLEYSNAIDKMSLSDRQTFSTAFGALWANRAACHMNMGDLKQAINDCEKAHEADPTNAKVLVRRSACFRNIERYKEAFVDLQKAIEINPSLFSTAQNEYNQLKQYLQTENGPKWMEKLPKFNNYGVESSNEKFNRLKMEGNECVKTKDYKKAIELYSECIEVDNEKPVAFANRAQCYMSLNDFESAELDCNKALELLVENPDENLQLKVFYRRCMARKSQKAYKAAMDDLTKVMKQQPKNETYRKLFDELMALHRSQAKSQTMSKGDVKTSPSVNKHIKKPEGKKVQIVEVDDDDDDENENDSNHDEEMTSKVSLQTSKSEKSPTLNSDVEMKEAPKEACTDEKQAKPKNQPPVKIAQEPSEIERKSVEPVLNAQTPFEFTQAWQSIKHLNDPKLYAKLIDQVEDLSQVITLKMDADMLATLCGVFDLEYKNRPKDCLRHMESLSKVPRLNFITMFLKNEDKEVIKRVLSSLEEYASSTPEDSQKVRTVKQKFKI